MKALGLNFSNDAYFTVVLEGDANNVTFIASRKVNFPVNAGRREKLKWLHDEILTLIDEFAPDQIGQRISLGPDSTDKLFTFGANVGASFLAAATRDTPITEFTSQSFTAKRFGFGRGVDKYKWIDGALGKHPPYWNRQMKDAAFGAWSCLK